VAAVLLALVIVDTLLLAFVAYGLGFDLRSTGGRIVLGVMAVSILVVAASALVFRSMTLRIDGERLSWRFGPGVLGRSVSLREIRSADPGKAPGPSAGIQWSRRGWYYGVGSRGVVEIHIRGGKRLLLGTDEPQALAKRIRESAGLPVGTEP
jgi:hypothetical protein